MFSIHGSSQSDDSVVMRTLKVWRRTCWQYLASRTPRKILEEPFQVFCNQTQELDTNQNLLQSPGRFIAMQLGNWKHDLFGQYISELSDLALITGYWLDNDNYYCISFHPLVRDWVRLRLPTSSRIRDQEYGTLVTIQHISILFRSRVDRRVLARRQLLLRSFPSMA